MNNWTYRYYYLRLSVKLQDVYNLLFDNWRKMNYKVRLPHNSYSKEEIAETIKALIRDYPGLFWVNHYTSQIEYSLLNTTIVNEPFCDNEETIRMVDNIRERRNVIIEKIPDNISDKEKVWTLFDFLSRTIEYNNSDSDLYTQTIAGPLTKEKQAGVCEAISKTFKYICDKMNIPCLIVFGNAIDVKGQNGPHSWNIVEIDGQKYHIDLTSQLMLSQIKGKATRHNYLFKDKDMYIYSWDKKEVPAIE